MTILRKTPKQLLTESLKELASKNTINKICVTDIARNCSMSNSNFYHHFADKYELIAYIINNEIDEKIGYSKDQVTQESEEKDDTGKTLVIDLEATDGILYNDGDTMMEIKYPESDIRVRVKER
jgi:AcrR family transcriptional regulator